MWEADTGRQAAHVILDAVSAYELADRDMSIVDAALERMNDIGAVWGTQDTDTGQVTFHADDLMGAVVVVVQGLVAALADCRGVDQRVVISDLRGWVDEEHHDPLSDIEDAIERGADCAELFDLRLAAKRQDPSGDLLKAINERLREIGCYSRNSMRSDQT